MKKTVGKVLVILFLLTLASALLLVALSVEEVAFAADENEDSRVAGSENVFDEILKNELVQNIATFVCSVFGSLAGLLCVIRKIKNTGVEMRTAIKRCADGDEAVEKTVKELIDAKKSLEENAIEMKKEIESLRKTVGSLLETNKEIEEARRLDSEKIRHMLQLGFCGNSELVRSGKAAAIYEVNNGKNN